LDTLNPATAGEARRSTIMARKNYTEEFRRQAVDLYRSTPGASLRGIAADLGITRGTLATWVAALDPETTSTPDEGTAGTATSPSRRATRTGPTPGPARAGSARAGSAQTELALLRARVAALETANATLATERDILRQAAKYFAGETRW
jgi:transposase